MVPHKGMGIEIAAPACACMCSGVSGQISAVPDLCCTVTRRLVESIGGVFDPVVSSATAVFEHVKDKLAVIPFLLPATLYDARQGVDPFSPWGATGVAAPSPVQSIQPVQCEYV